MESITFRCSACQHTLKVGADKAGRKARCNKCGADLTIPAAASAPAPPPVPAPTEDEDDGSAYGLVEGFEAAPPAEDRKKKKGDDERGDKKRKKDDEDEEEEEKKDRGPKVPAGAAGRRSKAPRQRTLLEPERWNKVRIGLILISVGLWAWMGGVVLRQVPLLIGISQSTEYAKLAMRYSDPESYVRVVGGSKGAVKLSAGEFLIGVTSGNENLSLGLTLFRIAEGLALLGGVIMLIGFGLCIPIPPRFGSRGQVIALLVLGVVNVIFWLVFRLLPYVGAMEYVVPAIAVPEIALYRPNQDRSVSLPVFFASAPYLDYTLTLFFWGAYCLQPILIAVFLRTIALAMRDQQLDETAQGMIRLGLGQSYALLAFLMMTVVGTSEVLMWVLRAVYALWAGFFIGMLAWYATMCLRVPSLIEKELGDE